jgi:hypothetical protein
MSNLAFTLISFETGSYYVAQADLKLVIFLLQSPECWDYRYLLPCSTALPKFVWKLYTFPTAIF